MAVIEIKHPLILDKLTRLRKKQTTDKKIFKENVIEITKLMAYEVFRDLQLQDINIETPIATTKGYKVKSNIIAIPILRAGLGMVDGIISLVPNATIVHLGIYRDKNTLLPQQYFVKKPQNLDVNSYVVVVDPMLATGGSVCNAIDIIKQWKLTNIKLISLVVAPEGIEKVTNEHSDVDIYVASIDEKLNSNGYIVPGLGDAGDRMFGTH